MALPLCFIVLLFSSFSSSAQSYQKIHRKALVADTHNDILISILEGKDIATDLSGQTHSDLERFKKGGVDIQVFSVWSDERYGAGKGFLYANRQIDSLYAITSRNPEKMMIVLSPADLQQAVREKKLGVMMGLEGGHMIEDKLAYLETLYQRGVRYMTLTWNNSTSWASSAKDESAGSLPVGTLGLNNLGKDIVRRMNNLGMLVDLSHVGEKTFWDAMNLTTKPVIVSHSCVYALCPVPRNLKDEQIKAVGKNGGVIHLNFYSGFLDPAYNQKKAAFTSLHTREIDSLKRIGAPAFDMDVYLAKKYSAEVQNLRAPLSLLLDHLDHIVRLIGVGGVGIGSDFDGIESPPMGLDDVSYLPNLTKGLRERGYSKKDIKKILGENFVRIFTQAQLGKN
ncbi:MAG: dipeptidase [Chitinophagaceae bacterium]